MLFRKVCVRKEFRPSMSISIYLLDRPLYNDQFVFFSEDSEQAEWVDLLLNPEQYTGYQGVGANRIWMSIYQENCFFPNKKMRDYDDFQSSFLSKTCLEKRAFYRTVSGLHASINIHLSYKFLTQDGGFSKARFEPNLDEFRKRFDAETTNGNGKFFVAFFCEEKLFSLLQYFSHIIFIAICNACMYCNTYQIVTK